jgi:hypothetical protein
MPTLKTSANLAFPVAKLVTITIPVKYARLRFLKLMTLKSAWKILARLDISKKASIALGVCLNVSLAVLSLHVIRALLDISIRLMELNVLLNVGTGIDQMMKNVMTIILIMKMDAQAHAE